MYPTQGDFNRQMEETSRDIHAKVEINYTDPSIDTTIHVSANENANHSYPEQTADQNENIAGKISSLDGSWELDGAYELAPGPENQLGWWGRKLSGDDGFFSEPFPTLTIEFASRPILAFQIVSDTERNEWPVDFDINLYSNDSLIYTENVEGNNGVTWYKELDEVVTQVTRMELIIKKWNQESRQAKIIEFYSGIRETYERKDIMLINLLEEREISKGSLPVGNISSNEIDIRLYNRDRKFDAGNYNSKLYQLLRQNRKIKAWLGITNNIGDISETKTVTSSKEDWEQGQLTDVVATSASELKLSPLEKTYLSFTEESDYCEMPVEPVPQEEITIDVEFKLSDNSIEVQPLIVQSGYRNLIDDVFHCRGIVYNGNAKILEIWSRDSSGAWKYIEVPFSDTNDYHRVRLIQNNSIITGYLDDENIGSMDMGSYLSTYYKEFRLGQWIDYGAGQEEFIGNISKVAIWNKDKGANNLDISLNGDESGLIGYYQIDENSGDTIYDDTNNNNDGVIYGASWGVAGAQEGVRESPQINISEIGNLQNSNISWQGDLLENVTIEVSIDEGPWQECSNDQDIPGLTEGNQYNTLDCRQILTRDAGNSPVLQSLIIEVTTIYGETTKEEIPLGVFWSGDWSAPEGEVYAQTTGRDRLQLFERSTYSSSQVKENVTLYELAVDVLEDYGLSSSEYFVDEELQDEDYIIPRGYIEPQTHREALRLIAEASLGQCFCDRDGKIRLEGFSYLKNKTISEIEITADNYFSKDNPNNYSELANYITVETQPLKPKETEEVYRSDEPVEILATETITITAYYNNEPCVDAVASIEGVGSISSVTYYSWGAEIEITSDTDGTFELIVNAKPLEVRGSEKVKAKDDESIRDNGLSTYEFPNNPLVQTKVIAQRIAISLLEYHKKPRRDLTMDWRGNPALLLGDRTTIKDKYSSEDFFVIRQNLEYDGALRADMEGRKA